MLKDWVGKVWELTESVYYWIKSRKIDKVWRSYKTWLELAEEGDGRWAYVREVVFQVGERQFLWWLLLKRFAGAVLGSFVLSFSFEKFIVLLRRIRLANVFLKFQSKFIVFNKMVSGCQTVLNGSFCLETVMKVKTSIFGVLRVANRIAIMLAKRLAFSSVQKILFSKIATAEITIYNWWQNNTTWQALSDRNNGLWYRN